MSTTLKAFEFETKCLKLMDEVMNNREEIVTTKNRCPIGRLMPYRAKPERLYGVDKGRFEILGDVVAPAAVEWDALTGKTWDGDHLFLSTLLEFTNT